MVTARAGEVTTALAARLAGTAFAAWHQRREGSLPWWPVERVQALQDGRTRAIVAHAYRHVPFYRECMDARGLRVADFHTAADLVRLPLVTSADLAASPERFQAARMDRRTCLDLVTTGTSGLHKHILHDRSGLLLALAAGARQRSVLTTFVGHGGRYRELVIQRPGSTTPLVRAALERATWVPRRLDLERVVMSPEEPLAKNIAAINTLRPDVVSGFSAYLGALFRWGWEHRALEHHPAVVSHGGDTMSPVDAELISGRLGIPLVASYQACEALRIAFQCEERVGYHLSLDCVVLRLVDAAGNDVGPGRSGDVVVSNLHNRATVLLNYCLGDRARLATAPCRCGRSLPCLEALEGRVEDLLLRPDGEIVHESVVLPALYRVAGLHQVQVEQTTQFEAVVRVVCASGASAATVTAGAGAALRRLLGDHPRLEVRAEAVERLAATPGGKVRGVISHCHGSAPTSAERKNDRD